MYPDLLREPPHTSQHPFGQGRKKRNEKEPRSDHRKYVFRSSECQLYDNQNGKSSSSVPEKVTLLQYYLLSPAHGTELRPWCLTRGARDALAT